MVQLSTHLVVQSIQQGLSCQHRAWIALYSLQNGATDRNLVLLQNRVTEADLREHQASWYRLRAAPALRKG